MFQYRHISVIFILSTKHHQINFNLYEDINNIKFVFIQECQKQNSIQLYFENDFEKGKNNLSLEQNQIALLGLHRSVILNFPPR